MTRKKTKVFLPLLALFFVLFSTGCQLDVGEASRSVQLSESVQLSKYEEKIYWTGNIDEDFNGSRVSVIMDKYTGGINKKHEPSFFGDFEKVSVTDLTVLTEYGISVTDKEIFRQILTIELPVDSKENVIRAIRELEKIEGIKYAGPDYYCYLDVIPNDPRLSSQWGLTGPAGIQVPNAWNITTGSSSVRVGIIDTGIANHPDLNANLADGRDFSTTTALNGTPISRTSSVDREGHGTHVAGIVGAVGNNGIGISGVCWNVSLVPLKVSDANGVIPTSAITNAINYAKNNGIPILNMSIGTWGGRPLWEQAIRQYPGLFICSAGNDSNNNDTIPYYPSIYRLPNLIAVGAINSNGGRRQTSNYGANTVDIFAPGGYILSTYPEAKCINGTHDTVNSIHVANGYHIMNGTSMASPYVAGVAALIKSIHPTLSASAIKALIESNVDVVPALQGLCVTGGRLNAFKALLASLVPISTNTIQVTAPVPGRTPVSAITATQYTGTVSWSPNHSVFQAATTYTATIILTPKPGYTWSGIPANFFSVPGAASTNNVASSIVTAVFPPTATTVTINITGVTVPVIGATPVSTITDTSQYTGNVTWNTNHSVFQADTTYTATINLYPETGYSFYGVPANFFAVAGAVSTSNAANSGTVTAVFQTKDIYASFDIVIDGNVFDLVRRTGPNRSIFSSTGTIGVFNFYTDGTWGITRPEEEIVWYVLPFNPENESFFDALEWPSDITDYFSTEDIAYVPLTVEFPMLDDVSNNCIYAAYSMGIEITGNGINLAWSDDEVEVLMESISYVPMPIWAVPVEGVIESES